MRDLRDEFRKTDRGGEFFDSLNRIVNHGDTLIDTTHSEWKPHEDVIDELVRKGFLVRRGNEVKAADKMGGYLREHRDYIQSQTTT